MHTLSLGNVLILPVCSNKDFCPQIEVAPLAKLIPTDANAAWTNPAQSNTSLPIHFLQILTSTWSGWALWYDCNLLDVNIPPLAPQTYPHPNFDFANLITSSALSLFIWTRQNDNIISPSYR